MKCVVNTGMMECLHNELKALNLDIKTTTILPYFVETNPKVTARLNLRYENDEISEDESKSIIFLF